MAIDDLNTAFASAMDNVSSKVLGDDSIYDKTLLKIADLYDTIGIDAATKNAAILQIASQLAVSATDKAISVSADLAKSHELIDAQVETEKARKELLVRQKEGFNDKLKVEVMTSMSGIAQMEATAGETQATTLLSVNKTLNKVYEAAGIETAVFTES